MNKNDWADNGVDVGSLIVRGVDDLGWLGVEVIGKLHVECE